jgi:hypothetical protein
MLNYGASAKPYQPYFTGLKNAQISGIKSIGRNLWNINSGITGRTFAGLTQIESNIGYTMWAIPIPKNTTIAFDMKEVSATPNGEMFIAFANDTKIGTPCYKDNNLPTFYNNWDKRTTNNVDYKYLLLCCLSTSISYFENNLHLTHGSTSLPYEQYTESVMQLPQTVELDKWDYIENGQIVRQTNTIEFNGSEEIYLNILTENVKSFSYYIDEHPAVRIDDINSVSTSQYNDVQANDINSGSATGVAVYGTTIRIADNRFTTADELKAYFAEQYANGTPIKVAYHLATPTYEPITFDNKYLVWDKGTEQVITPTDERGLTCFVYGAKTKEEIEYMILLGGAE